MVFGKALEDRDLKRKLVLVVLTACDCEEQVEILRRGNRGVSGFEKERLKCQRHCTMPACNQN